jgi:hypothetical protein
VAERLGAALRADALVLLWLAAAIGNVARLRFFSADDISGAAGGPDGPAVRRANGLLRNTAEQVLLATGAHLALAASLERPVPLVAMLVALFCAGRALFWWGHARGAAARALGFGLTFYPSVLALLLSAALLLT